MKKKLSVYWRGVEIEDWSILYFCRVAYESESSFEMKLPSPLKISSLFNSRSWYLEESSGLGTGGGAKKVQERTERQNRVDGVDYKGP